MSAAGKNAGVAVAALGLLFAASRGAAQTGDAARGAKVFQACAACHSVKAGGLHALPRHNDRNYERPDPALGAFYYRALK